MRLAVVLIVLLVLVCSLVACDKQDRRRQRPVILSVMTATPKPFGPQPPASDSPAAPYPVPSMTATRSG